MAVGIIGLSRYHSAIYRSDVSNFYNMVVMDNPSQSQEPAISGWWIIACFAVAGLILLFAVLIQQASRLSNTFFALTGGHSMQAAEAVAENPSRDSEQNLDRIAVDSPITEDKADGFVAEPDTEFVVAQESVDASIAESAAGSIEITDVIEESIAPRNDFAESVRAVAEIDLPTDQEPVMDATGDPAVDNTRVDLMATESKNSLAEPETSPESALASMRRDALTEMSRRSKLIRFEESSFELTPSAEQLLGLTFEDLFLYAESDIDIEVGSSDGTDVLSSQMLSRMRANTIRDYLIGRGIEPERLQISLLPDTLESDELQYVNIKANL